jgi:predicted amidophosphoribosyltransferase
MLHYLLNFLFPQRCAACDASMPIDATRRVCAPCLAAIEPPRPPLCVVCGASLHTGEAERCGHCRTAPPAFDSARAITRYRAGGADFARDGSGAVATLLRRHKYGLDQSLGRALAEYVDAATLACVRSTPPQTASDRKQRAHNVSNAFAVRRPARVADRRILLVDDVMTTGATADECARVLRAAGARRVDVLTLARVS